MKTLLLILFSYFLGSIPFGLIIGKLCRGIDIRRIGSGNIGATNVYRVLGLGPGLAVFALDVAKGFIPVAVARHFMPESSWILVACAMIAILGHTLSVFLNFRGGKGVATSLGVLIGLDHRVALACFVAWVLVLAITRYVSIASIIAALTVASSMFIFHLPPLYKAFGIVAAALVIFKHRSNISRLINRTEPKLGKMAKTTSDETSDPGTKKDKTNSVEV